MSRVVEGFYVRFFWDWLAFISGAFRWKVFAVFADDVGETSSLSPHAALLTPCPIAINAALDTVVKWSTKTGHRVRVFSSIDFPIRLVVTHHYIRAVLVRCNIQRYSPLLRELHR